MYFRIVAQGIMLVCPCRFRVSWFNPQCAVFISFASLIASAKTCIPMQQALPHGMSDGTALALTTVAPVEVGLGAINI